MSKKDDERATELVELIETALTPLGWAPENDYTVVQGTTYANLVLLEEAVKAALDYRPNNQTFSIITDRLYECRAFMQATLDLTLRNPGTNHTETDFFEIPALWMNEEFAKSCWRRWIHSLGLVTKMLGGGETASRLSMVGNMWKSGDTFTVNFTVDSDIGSAELGNLIQPDAPSPVAGCRVTSLGFSNIMKDEASWFTLLSSIILNNNVSEFDRLSILDDLVRGKLTGYAGDIEQTMAEVETRFKGYAE